MATRPGSSLRRGNHGVLYVSGVRTCGRILPYDGLQGRRIRGLYGGRGQFVAVVDAWDLAWQPSRHRSDVLEHETVDLMRRGKGDLKIQQIAFGAHHRVALTLDGHMYAWGTRDAVCTSGELGHVASAWHPVVLTPRSTTERAITTASAKGGRDNVYPEMETDAPDHHVDDRENPSSHTSTSICEPRRIHTPPHLFFTKVACGAFHSVALTDKGDLYAWGRNADGQLGLASTTLPSNLDRVHNAISAWPKFVSALMGQPPVVDVACADMFTIALLADGSVWRWGERVAGITGQSSSDTMDARPRRLQPSSISSSSSSASSEAPFFTGIAAGAAHVVAVTKSGELFSWGLNAYGQLGLGDAHRTSSDTPCRVPSTIVWTNVFAGSYYSAAIASDGQLFTWGHNHHGQLGHTTPTTQCEFAPRAVDALRGVCVTSVVCGQRHLFAFAPTVVTSITPVAGELTGGYVLRISGSGFYDSEDLTVRFVPLTEGRLMRGAFARFDAATHTVVCTVPAFSLPGEFAVEVATNGKHFTSDGHVLEAFKRPTVVGVSRWAARLAGGDEVEITLDGTIPHSCTQPLLGLVAEEDPARRIHVPGAVEVLISSAPTPSPHDDSDTAATPTVGTTTLLRFKTPEFEHTTRVARCALELSFNNGHQFMPIHLDSSSTSSEPPPLGLQFHNAAVTQCRPNSFHARTLPTPIYLHVRHLLTPTDNGDVDADWRQLSVALRIASLNVSDAATESRVDVLLMITHVERSLTNESAVVTCLVPPMTEWHLSKRDAKTGERVVIATDWWKFVPRWGFEASVRVSMDEGRSLLPMECGGAVYGVLTTTGKVLTASPLVTPLAGGTLVSIAADFFHFDTDDAVVVLRWKDQREARVAATCSTRTSTSTSNSGPPLTRWLTFTTAALPFPLAHSPSTHGTIGDNEPTSPLAEESLVPDDTVELSTEVDVLIALDGRHFHREASLRITYYRSPELLEVSPSEAPPGTRMILKVDKAPPPSTALTTACVRLTTATLDQSTVVPVHVTGATDAFEFVVPVLPISEEDMVRVAFSLDGQQFSSDRVATDISGESVHDVSFRYRAPPTTSREERS